MSDIRLSLGCYYDVCFKKHYKKSINGVENTFETTLNKLMFWYSTNCYYVFWTGSELVRIRKDLIISIKEI